MRSTGSPRNVRRKAAENSRFFTAFEASRFGRCLTIIAKNARRKKLQRSYVPSA